MLQLESVALKCAIRLKRKKKANLLKIYFKKLKLLLPSYIFLTEVKQGLLSRNKSATFLYTATWRALLAVFDGWKR